MLIADDHAVLRSGLTMLLNAQPDMVVVGEASDGDEAVQRTAELAPDVLLLDITMPGSSGVAVIHAIKAKELPVAILVLTMHEDGGFVVETLKAGAMGYIPKRAADSELIAAIRAVNSGEVHIYSSLVKAAVGRMIGGDGDGESSPSSLDPLSPRETEILSLVAQGYSNRQIATDLNLSVKTIETYKARVMEKLDLHSRVELVRYALQHGLLAGQAPSAGDGPLATG